MIAEVKAHITASLVAAGIASKIIAQDAKDIRVRKITYSELITETEAITRDGTKSGRVFDGATNQATNTVRVFRRELPVNVRIVHRSEADVDALLTAFLIGLGRGFKAALPAPSANSQFIRAITGPATWESDPSLLKDKAEVAIRILFRGGIYEETIGGTIQQINPPTVNMV